jgi:hypothetical protein
MNNLSEIGSKIKALKIAREILQQEYAQTEFHKKKVDHPHSTTPAKPEDEEIYKLLTAIQQIELYIKKLQDEQFKLIKQEDI